MCVCVCVCLCVCVCVYVCVCVCVCVCGGGGGGLGGVGKRGKGGEDDPPGGSEDRSTATVPGDAPREMFTGNHSACPSEVFTSTEVAEETAWERLYARRASALPLMLKLSNRPPPAIS